MTYETSIEELKNALSFVNESDYESAKKICLDVISSIDKVTVAKEQSSLLARCYNILAETYLRETYYSNAFEYVQKAIVAANECAIYFEQSTSQYILAQCYLYQEEYYKALEAIYLGLRYVPSDDEHGLTYFGYIHLSNVYSTLHEYPKSLENLLLALHYFQNKNAPRILGKIFTDIAEVYSHLDDREKALEFLIKALELHQSIGYERGIAFLHIQLGLHYFALKDYNTAYEYHVKALNYFKELNVIRGIAVGYTNIADIQFELGEFEEAYTLYQTALEHFQQISDNRYVAFLNIKIAKIFAQPNFSLYNVTQSEELFLQTIEVFKSFTTQNELKEAYFELVNVYKISQNWEKAFEYLEYYNSIELETSKQNSLLEIRNNEFKNMMDLAEKEKVITERLLSQMLPTGIASRLIEKKDVTEQFENVSIMFADLVGYTKISDSMSHSDIFTVLNYVIGLIDTIVLNNNCERLKTIGDCYMAMSGIPQRSSEHSFDLAKVALEVMTNLQISPEIQLLLPKNYSITFRIGLHCGPVSAGLIGNNRFQYDVYGDTVNIASRLETQGEAGRIHISEQFAKSIEHHAEFELIPRGQINIKGKGSMNTFWLEKAK